MSVDADGTVLSDTKPVYCEAFFIMGLAEYYHATGSEEALEMCLKACELMETHAKITPRHLPRHSSQRLVSQARV